VDQQGLMVLKRSTFSLVDLAGSEKWRNSLNVTGNSGNSSGSISSSSSSVVMEAQTQMKEMTNINSSLHVLGNCVSALIEPGRKHIPYRDSTLTRLLQDALGGNGRTVLIATIRTDSMHKEETYSTLQFASRASHIKVSLTANVGISDHLSLVEAQRQIKILHAKLVEYQNAATAAVVLPFDSMNLNTSTSAAMISNSIKHDVSNSNNSSPIGSSSSSSSNSNGSGGTISSNYVVSNSKIICSRCNQMADLLSTMKQQIIQLMKENKMLKAAQQQQQQMMISPAKRSQPTALDLSRVVNSSSSSSKMDSNCNNHDASISLSARGSCGDGDDDQRVITSSSSRSSSRTFKGVTVASPLSNTSLVNGLFNTSSVTTVTCDDLLAKQSMSPTLNQSSTTPARLTTNTNNVITDASFSEHNSNRGSIEKKATSDGKGQSSSVGNSIELALKAANLVLSSPPSRHDDVSMMSSLDSPISVGSNTMMKSMKVKKGTKKIKTNNAIAAVAAVSVVEESKELLVSSPSKHDVLPIQLSSESPSFNHSKSATTSKDCYIRGNKDDDVMTTVDYFQVQASDGYKYAPLYNPSAANSIRSSNEGIVVAVTYRESSSPSSSYDHTPPYYEPSSSSTTTKTTLISESIAATSKINTAGATTVSSSAAAADVTNETPTKRAFDRPNDRSSATKTQLSTPVGHDVLITESKSRLITAAAAAVVQEGACANHLTSSIDHNNSVNSHSTKSSMLLSDEHKASNHLNQDVCNKHGLEKCVLCTMFNTTPNTTKYFGAVELGGYSSNYSGGHKAQNYFINNNNSNNKSKNNSIINNNSSSNIYSYSKPSTLAPISYNESIMPSATIVNPSTTIKNTPPSSSPSSSLLLRGTDENIAITADDLCRKHSLQDCVLCGMLRPPVVQTKRTNYDIQPSDNYNNGVGHQDNTSVKYHQQHNPSSRMRPTMNSTMNGLPPSSSSDVVQNSHSRHQLLQIHQELQLPFGDVNMYNSTYSGGDYNNNNSNIYNDINNNDNSSLMNNSYNSISSLNQNSTTSLNSNASWNNNSYNNIIIDNDYKNSNNNNNNNMIDPLQQHVLDDQYSHCMINEEESFIQKAITSNKKMISIPAKTPNPSHSKHQPSIEFVSSIDSLDSSINYGSNNYYHLRNHNDNNENKNIYHVNNSSIGGSSAQVRNVKAIAQLRQHQNHRNDNDQSDCEITYNADGICNNDNNAHNNNYNNYSSNKNNYNANNYNENYIINNSNNINSSQSKIQALQQMQRKSVNNNANITSNQAAALLPRSSSSPLPKSSSSFKQMMLDHDDHSHRSGLVIKAHHNRSQNPNYEGNDHRLYDMTELPARGSTALGSKIVYIDDDDGDDDDDGGGGGIDYREDDGENNEAVENNYDDDGGGGGNTAVILSARNYASAVADSENNQFVNDKVTVKKKKKVKRKKKAAALNTIAGILSSHKATTGGVASIANHHLQSLKRRPLK